jgi:hypothetical protein
MVRTFMGISAQQDMREGDASKRALSELNEQKVGFRAGILSAAFSVSQVCSGIFSHLHYRYILFMMDRNFLSLQCDTRLYDGRYFSGCQRCQAQSLFTHPEELQRLN